MKKVSILFASVCVALMALSCQKSIEEITPPDENVAQLTTITCEFPSITDQNGTKVSLAADGTTGWVAGDKIAIYGARNSTPGDASTHIDPIIHTLTASEVVNPQVAIFDVDLTGLIEDPAGKYPYNAAYPADDWAFYSDWYSSARARFYETNQILLAGYIDGGKMTLLNLCGVIMFQVEGDFDQYQFFGNNNEVVGYDDYLVEVNASTPNYLKKPGEEYGTNGPKKKLLASVNGDGTTLNYIFVPNEANLTAGFTIQFLKDGVIKKYVKSQASLTLTHGHGINLGKLPDSAIHDYVAPSGHPATHPSITGATDLGATATANSYIVVANEDNKDKVFKFKAVKGNSDAGVGAIDDVVVLWETYNNQTTVVKNSVIADVDFEKKGDEDDYWITLQMPASPHAGNAVIAAKDKEGTILWSWHIWAPSTAITTNTYGIYSSALMDRNLGALVATQAGSVATVESFGLLYQWGRKDPFVGPKRVDSSSRALVNGAEAHSTSGDGAGNDDSKITLAQSIADPTLLGHKQGGDWITPSDQMLWKNAEKTMYDPCPPGYRVPARDKSQPLHGSDLSTATGWEDNTANKYFTIGSPLAVFPYTGYYDTWSSSLSSVSSTGSRTVLWTAYSSSDEIAYNTAVRTSTNGDRHKLEEVGKCNTSSVRCCVE